MGLADDQFFLGPIDYARHNAEVATVWQAYHAGHPLRVPVGNFTIGPRVWLLNPALNTEGVGFEEFTTRPDLMYRTLLRYKHYFHHNIISDIEMGVPDQGWEVFVEFNNVTEAAWLGCPVVFPPGQVVATVAAYQGDAKRRIFDGGLPHPFDGIYARVRETYEYFLDRARDDEFHGKPVRVALPWVGLTTDGPLTVALDVRGDEIFSDMYLDPDYYHELMTFIVDATIRKIRAWRKYLGIEPRPPAASMGDDALQMISVDTYNELVLPYHQRLLQELWGEGPHALHLCGNVQRHLPNLVRKLNFTQFDTGYPIDFNTLRSQVGEHVQIQGGVPVDVLLRGTPETVMDKARDILRTNIMQGGRFILKEANNLPPGVPVANLQALYQAARCYGQYPAA